MAVSINGSGAITFNDGSTQSSSQVGMKNRIIDGGFIINQRVYTTGTSLSAGSYGHDRWKAGSGGGTYTFTQGSLGVNTTITITAGTLVQVIEGCNLAEGGTYVLSWTGTAQGRLNGGTYGSSGTVTVTGWTAGSNLSVEFSTGTLGSVQLEKGSTATSFDYRPYSTELALCQRYYEKSYDINIVAATATSAGMSATPTNSSAVTNYYIPVSVSYKVAKRTQATITIWDIQGNQGRVTNYTAGGMTPTHNNNTVWGITSGDQQFWLVNTQNAAVWSAFQWTAVAEL